MEKLVSAIIPVYNGEKYIEKCIKSLRSQTYGNLEIIIVDDGSTDNTVEICNKYALNGEIVFYKQKNCGPAQARNFAINKARGEYLAFIDADDYVEAEYISYLVYNLEYYQADISSCGWREVDEDGNIIDKCIQYDLTCYDLESMCIPENRIPFTVWHMLYKKELLNSGKFQFDSDIYYQEDLLFNYKMLLEAKKMVDSCKPLYNRVINENSLTNQRWSLEWYEKWFTIILAQERIVNMLKSYPRLYSNAIYNQSLETAKIYCLSKKHNIDDEEKINKIKGVLKDNRKKIRIIGRFSVKSMLFTVACCYTPTLYCRLRGYNLR